MSLILLRHTRPDIAEGTCYGRTDLGLPATFAEDAARAVADLPRVARIVTSPLTRCRRLAEHVAETRALPLCSDARIVEMDFGSWERRPWSEIPRAELDAWAGDFEGARPHGGENLAMLAARVGAALAERGDEPELWVTHSGVIRAVCARLGLADGWDTAMGFGKWMEVSG